jgi:hypothetical protein
VWRARTTLKGWRIQLIKVRFSRLTSVRDSVAELLLQMPTT